MGCEDEPQNLTHFRGYDFHLRDAYGGQDGGQVNHMNEYEHRTFNIEHRTLNLK
jgi:hypothetical protein